MTSFKVCRFAELVKGDQFLEPWSGALARVDSVSREAQKQGPPKITVAITMMVSKSIATLTLPPGRWMRRKLREGETDA